MLLDARGAASVSRGRMLSRYHFAGELVRRAEVLVIEPSEVFGPQILADAGALQVLVLLNASAAHPRRAGHEELSHVVADPGKLPVDDRSFDLVTVLETSGIDDLERYLTEAARALRSGGRIVVGVAANSRSDASELRSLLHRHFSAVEICEQTPHHRYPEHFRTTNGSVPPLWKLLELLPHRWRDRLTRLFLNQPYYPGEYDWVYTSDLVDPKWLVGIGSRLEASGP